MNNLKTKIFWIIYSILSLFLIVIFISFNVSIYQNEYNKLEERFIRLSSNKDDFNFDIDDINKLFLDDDIYILFYSNSGKYEGNISLSQNPISEKKLFKIVSKNIEQIKSKKIGNLYVNKYLFKTGKNHTLIIINNSTNRLFLLYELRLTIVLFIISEAISGYIIYLITKSIVKPVYESFEKQKQFISDASHELKTPLAIISASTETLENDISDTKWLDTIKEESERMNKLVLNLLELSKTDDYSNLVLTKVNLSKLILKKSLSFESLMFENNISLNTDIQNDIYFACDEDRIKELLSILIDNAIKYSDKKSSINVILEKDKTNIILKVINKGKSIPESEYEKIFERFYRIDKSRNRKNNNYGLGLSIAKNIVNNHKGTIKVYCKDGYTTFQINFKYNL